MKLSFRPYVDRRIRTLDVAWASNLHQVAPVLRGGLEVKLDWVSMWLGGPCYSSTPSCSSPYVPSSYNSRKLPYKKKYSAVLEPLFSLCNFVFRLALFSLCPWSSRVASLGFVFISPRQP
jgi:hypothetical protein